MEIVKFVVGVLLPYVAILSFLAGMSYRIYSWLKLPSPAMTLFPAPATERENRLNAVKEAALFRGLFHGDRTLWLVAWPFHLVLALILFGHLRVFVNADVLLEKLGMSESGIQAMSASAGGSAGILIGAGALLLLLRRIAVPRVREITGFADYAILLLLAAILVTGNLLRFAPRHFDLSLTRAYFAGLAGLPDVSGARVLEDRVFLVHMTLAFLLIMLMPFSKLLHLGGIFFTHHLVRKH